MSAWGPAIFSDDLACDVRDDYRELIESCEDDSSVRGLTFALCARPDSRKNDEALGRAGGYLCGVGHQESASRSPVR